MLCIKNVVRRFYQIARYAFYLVVLRCLLIFRNVFSNREISNVVVTLTSFDKRINSRFLLAIESIATQNMRPSKIFIYLTASDISNLSKSFYSLIYKYNYISIVECEDYLSYKKIIPILFSGYEGFFVTADDDIFYKKNWLRDLILAKTEINTIPAARVHRILVFENLVSKYVNWEWDIRADKYLLSINNFATSGAGLLLHTSYFDKDDFIWENIKICYRTCDDIYIYLRLTERGYLINPIRSNHQLIVEIYDPFLSYMNLNAVNNVDTHDTITNNDRAFLQLLIDLNRTPDDYR